MNYPFFIINKLTRLVKNGIFVSKPLRPIHICPPLLNTVNSKSISTCRFRSFVELNLRFQNTN